MSPFPSRRHQQVSRRLANRIEQALPTGFDVLQEWGWKPTTDEFGADVMVVPPTEEDVRFTGTPVLCVEIVSSNRSNDYVTTTATYAQAGLDHYWILDPESESLSPLTFCQYKCLTPLRATAYGSQRPVRPQA